MPKKLTKKSSISSLNSETKERIENLELEEELTKTNEIPISNNPVQSLSEYLTTLEKRWNDHLTGLTKQEYYEGQEEIINELIPFLEQALEPTNNINQWTNDLLTKWTTDYSQWKDDSKDLTTLQEVLIANSPNPLYQLIINNKISEEDLKDQAIVLEIKVNQLEKDLESAYQRNLQKTKEWEKLRKQSSEQLKSAVEAKASEYKSFINPNNKKMLTKHAKEKLGMLTKEEVEAKVNKFKLPLQDWENTFTGKSAQAVKEELAMAISEKSKYRLERRVMEIDRDMYKEDSERMVGEVASYYEEYKRFLDLLSKERDRTTALENQLYSLGVEPIPEEEEVNNDETESLADNSKQEEIINEEKQLNANIEVNSD